MESNIYVNRSKRHLQKSLLYAREFIGKQWQIHNDDYEREQVAISMPAGKSYENRYKT